MFSITPSFAWKPDEKMNGHLNFLLSSIKRNDFESLTNWILLILGTCTWQFRWMGQDSLEKVNILIFIINIASLKAPRWSFLPDYHGSSIGSRKTVARISGWDLNFDSFKDRNLKCDKSFRNLFRFPFFSGPGLSSIMRSYFMSKV